MKRAATIQAYEQRLLGLGSHEVPRRLEVIKQALKQSEEIGWRLMCDEWSYSEVNYHYAPIIKAAGSAGNLADIRRWFMTDEELCAWTALPESVECWRGGEQYICHVGMSWSVKRSVAEFFLKYAYGPRRNMLGVGSLGKPVIVSATIPKEAVFAVKLDRKEHEVITFPVVGGICPHKEKVFPLSA